MKNKIKDINALEVLDSRGNPTIEVEVILDNGYQGRYIVPSGASKGEYEAYELRDNDKNYYNGLGVNRAVENINTIIKHRLEDIDPFNQKEVDSILIELDGTLNKSNLGANAILGVSAAILKACSNNQKYLYKYLSKNEKVNMPIPMLNVINGGKHANNNLDIQEYMIVPINCSSFKEGLRKAVEVYHKLKKVLKENNTPSYGVGDEGGYVPILNDDEEALSLIIKAIKQANYIPGKDFMLALDIAASEWYIKDKDKYYLPKKKQHKSKEELIKYYEELVDKYYILSIEDGMADNDITGWKLMSERLSQKIMLVGDDLFVTNSRRLQKGIKEKIANSILIKPNQIGTISEMIDTINLAKQNGYEVIMSHRSGDSEDSTISDLCVGLNVKYIKSGAPCRSERVSKYNQLLRIESLLNNS